MYFRKSTSAFFQLYQKFKIPSDICFEGESWIFTISIQNSYYTTSLFIFSHLVVAIFDIVCNQGSSECQRNISSPHPCWFVCSFENVLITLVWFFLLFFLCVTSQVYLQFASSYLPYTDNARWQWLYYNSRLFQGYSTKERTTILIGNTI